mmetsp:Transcript_108337/g.314925  ORF Transcript_108337/g.314925 Transcript_108337/m.314925 type:complete len:695 (-) Transcript_108337:444-2528(-)
MTFYYHMYGDKMGELKLQTTSDWDSWSVIWERDGNRGNEWKSATPSGGLVELPSNTSGVRFKAVTGSGKSGDMAIDDVVISVSAYREAKCDDEDDDDDWDDYSYFHSYSYDYEDDGYECGKGETCYDDEKDEDDEYKDVDSFSFSYEYSYACACPEDFTDCGTYCDFDGDCSGDDWCDVNGADNGWSEMCRLEYYEACDYYSCGKASVCEYTDDWWMWSYSYDYSYGDIPEYGHDDDECRPFYEMIADDDKCSKVYSVFDCTDGCGSNDCKSEALVAKKGRCLEVGLGEYTKVHHCESETSFTVKLYRDPRCHHPTGQVWTGTGTCTYDPDHCDGDDDNWKSKDDDKDDGTVTAVSWDTTFGLEGVSASDITDDDEASILTAIAATSDDTSEDDLEIISIEDISRRLELAADQAHASQAQAQAQAQPHARSLLASSGVEVTYTTTLILEETSYSDADSLFSAVTVDVETAVDNGGLEDELQAAASSDSQLKSVTVDSSSFTRPTKYTEETVEVGDDSVETKVVTEDNELVELILGLCVALALALGCSVGVYCTYKNRNQWLGGVHGQVPMAEAVIELPNYGDGQRASMSEPTFNPVGVGAVVETAADGNGGSYDPHGVTEVASVGVGEKNTLDATWDPSSAEFMTVDATPWSPSSGNGASANPFGSEVITAERVNTPSNSGMVVSANEGQAFSI